MQDWRFFDARCRVGLHLRAGPPPYSPHTVADLLADMDHFGVHEAMVLDTLSQENSPRDGNPRIVELTRDQPRLHPAWVALPPGTDETPPPQEMVSLMRRHRVGMICLFPGQYCFPLRDWCVDDLIGPLAQAHVPTLVSYQQIGPRSAAADVTDLPDLVDLCRRWPDLPVILSEVRIRMSMRALNRAMEACPNLHLELSGYWLHHGIEQLTRRFGAARLLFGSNWPQLGHGATLATVACAEVSDEDKRLIAGDNLRRLLRWCDVPQAKVTVPPPADELAAWARTGARPPHVRVHDNHGHLGAACAHYHVPDGSPEQLLREMDRLGVQQVCVFSLQGVFSDERYGNDLVIDAVRRFPERFLGFTLVNPHRGPEAMWRELQRCHAAGLRGVKLHATYQCYPEEGPNIDVACRWAHEQRQFILNHEWNSAAQVERLVQTYADACFFTGHTTTRYADVMKRHANLYVCSCPVHEPFHVERVVQKIGADRFLFGSDLSDLPIAWGLGPILLARLPLEERQLIIGGNLQRLMRQYSLPARASAAAAGV
jgi:predicted TIM-barrel fold metal-dependent hydrolase